MPSKKYMELDSNYRDRTQFPNAGAFEVNISQSGMKTNLNALDPITKAYPDIVFCPNEFQSVALKFTAATGDFDISACSSTSTFIVENDGTPTPPTAPAIKDGYYVGAMLKFTDTTTTTTVTTPPSPPTTTTTTGTKNYEFRILEWKVIDPDDLNSKFKVTIDGVLPELKDYTFTIYNPTDDSGTVYDYVFIPCSKSIDNFYNKYVVWDQDINKAFPILSYDGVTHLAKLDDLPPNFTSHTLVIRRQGPYDFGVLQAPAAVYSNIPTAFDISQRVSDSLINGFVRLYNTASPQPIDVTTGVVQDSANIVIRIVDVKPYEPIPTPPVYTPTNTIILDPKTTPAAVIANPANYSYEILPFTIDNASPFVFNGSISSQNQPIAQEITLNSLVLPNVALKNGGRIAYYPYVYVELENLSASASSNKNILFSNNPHTYKAVFKVPITDLNHPSVSPFVKLTGNGMTQTMTFKQNDNMRVAVLLPNGEIFESVDSDTRYGQQPNPLIQISFCFGIERV
jgi:hypothetical protein